MRFTLLTFTVACAAFASTPAQTTTYVDGNVTGLSSNVGGTLTFDDEKAMVLRTGLNTITVPYASVSRAELGAVKENSHDTAFYKFWQRKHKTQTQLLIVNFKDEQGAEKTMTLELSQPAAQTVLSDLESRTGKEFVASDKAAKPAPAPAAKKGDQTMATGSPDRTRTPWWGDDYWKTPRNADKWPKPAGSNDHQ